MAQATMSKWTTPDGALGFSTGGGNDGNDGQAGQVSVRVWRPAAPAQCDVVTVDAGKAAGFAVRFPGGYFAYGTLDLAWDGAGAMVLTVEVSYGPEGTEPPLQAHGVVASWPGPDQPPCPPPPPPCPPLPCPPARPAPPYPPAPADGGGPLDPASADYPVEPADPPAPAGPLPSEGGDGVLFPYMYIRKWPLLSPAQLALRFVSYAPLQASPPQEDLYGLLASAGSRAEMEALALDFIEGAPPFQGQFVTEADLHDGNFLLLSRLAAWLRRHPCEPGQIAAWVGAEAAPAVLGSAAYASDLERIWQSYFALVIAPWSEPALVPQMSMLLVASHVLAYVLAPAPDAAPLDACIWRQLVQASVILPKAVFPLPPAALSPPAASPPPSELGWIEPYAIGDLQMVRQRLLRYVPGEIAAIDNLARGERREVSRRSAHRQHELGVAETADSEELDSKASDTRADLLAETIKTIAEKTTNKNYTNLSTSYGPPTVATVNGGPVTTTVQQGPNADDVTRFARDVLNQTVRRIGRNVGSVRSSSLMQEAAETHSSVLDNSAGEADRAIVYRWVNKVYEARVVNYGQRLMLEFVLAAPAHPYRRDLMLGERAGVLAPPPPAAEGITSFADIGRDNYARLASQYQARDIVPPPLAMRYVSAVLASGESTLLAVPPGYRAVFAVVNAIAAPGAAAPVVLVGSKSLSPPYTAVAMPSGCGGALAVAVAPGTASASSPPAALGAAGAAAAASAAALVTVTVSCAPTDSAFGEWQIQTYNAIIAGYQALCARRGAVAPGARHGGGEHSLRSAHRIAARELRRGCLNLIGQRCAALTGEPDPLWRGAATLPPGPRRLSAIEDMFEWSEMSFRFYRKGEADGQPVAIDSDDDGAGVLSAFLDASLARVLVPARPEHAYGVLYLLSSGLPWEAGNALTPVDSVDVPVVNELKSMAEASHCGCHPVGPSWEVVVPTAMHIIDGVVLP